MWYIILTLFADKVLAAELIPQLNITINSKETAVFDIFNNLAFTLTVLAYPLAFAALLATSYILITSGGKPEAYATAKKNIMYITTGIFLIIFAVIFLRYIRGLFTL